MEGDFYIIMIILMAISGEGMMDITMGCQFIHNTMPQLVQPWFAEPLQIVVSDSAFLSDNLSVLLCQIMSFSNHDLA